MKKAFVQASAVPCFYCGSGYNQLCCHGGARRDGSTVNLAYHVACRKCRASGPVARSAEQAVKGWEHRAPPRSHEKPLEFLPDIEFADDEESGLDGAPLLLREQH